MILLFPSCEEFGRAELRSFKFEKLKVPSAIDTRYEQLKNSVPSGVRTEVTTGLLTASSCHVGGRASASERT